MNLAMRLFQRASNGIWYVEFPGGKRRSLGKEVRTEQEAKRVYNQIRREFLAGKLADITGQCTVTLGDYVSEYLEWAEKVQPRATFRANQLALRKLEHYAGKGTKLDRISVKHVDQMTADHIKKGRSTASINNYIRHMRAALNKAVEWDHVKRNPLENARELPKEKKPPLFMEQQQVTRFLKSIADIDLRRMATAYLATGRRRRELLDLTWEDVDLQRRRYYIRNAKNNLSKWYPINGMFGAVLDSIGLSTGRVFARWTHPDTISHSIKEVLIGCGMGHFHLHHLRHTFASLQVMQGRTLPEVQKLLGHTEFRTTEIYAHVSDDHIRNAAEINLGPVDLGSHGQKPDRKRENLA
jgi:integrase